MLHWFLHITLCGWTMPTNLAIDDELLKEALRVGGFKTKRQTVNTALSEFIARHKQREILELFGKVDFDPAFDYKRERRARGR